MKKRTVGWYVLIFIACLSLMTGCGSSGGSDSSAQEEKGTYYFYVSSILSGSSGTVTENRVFGVAPSTSAVSTENGALMIAPDSSITIEIPSGEAIPDLGILLELQINYLTENAEADEYAEASFRLEDDQAQVVAEGLLDNDDYGSHQTYTLQVDLRPYADSKYFKLTNTSTTYALSINNTIAVLPVEMVNDSGVYVADLRSTSSRIVQESTTAGESGWEDVIVAPTNYWNEGDVVFGLGDVIAGMSQPVLEFNFGRDRDDSSYVYLYDDQGIQIAYYEADYDSDESMGQNFIVDVSAYKNSTFFRLDLDGYEYLNPYVKVYDAAATSPNAILIDASPTGASYVAATGNFAFYNTYDDYPSGGMYEDNIGYGMPHWLADPTHETYGSGGTLEFSLPSSVATYGHPVLEIVHFSPDSEANLDSGEFEGSPDNYPVEFYLLDESDTQIAHIVFGEWEDDTGGVLKNQIPLGAFKTSSSLKIVVPADETRWSQSAFPPFFKIFDAYAQSN